jgi:F420-dependent oxidoreductase-like protein
VNIPIGIALPQIDPAQPLDMVPHPARALEMIARADALGVPAVWLYTRLAGPDPLTFYAAAAVRTTAIRLGTAIIPTFPRHPLVAAQQAQVVADLAPGRLVLGVGPSHRAIVSDIYGLPFERPLEQLGEYVAVLRAALHAGRVDFEGRRFRVHGDIPYPAPVPVMISALQARSFRLAGTLADGAITWVCPARYLRDVALPAVAAGAAEAGRPAPPVVANVFVALSEDRAAVASAARERLRAYPRFPFYAEMFAAAGYPEARQGEWSDGMLESVVLYGDEARVADGVRAFAATSGAGELIAALLPAGPDRAAEAERGLRFVADLNKR